MAIVILFKGGDAGVTLRRSTPQCNVDERSVPRVVLTFTGFIGFEAAASLGEETADPLRAIPKAILSAVLVALVFYVFVTWMMRVGLRRGNAAPVGEGPGGARHARHPVRRQLARGDHRLLGRGDPASSRRSAGCT